jgi:hypothetical protein
MWLRPAHTLPRDFQACVAAGNFPSENRRRCEKLRVKKIFGRIASGLARAGFRGKTDRRAFSFKNISSREAAPGLSNTKMTENLQKLPLIQLTEIRPVSISCGQGSGHPHPVVVDNVSGSFGNLASPTAFCRL